MTEHRDQNPSLRRRRVLTVLLLAAPSILGALVHVLVADRLPDPMPDPWDWSGGRLSLLGERDGVDPDSYYVGMVPIYLAMTVLAVVTLRSRGTSSSRTTVVGITIGFSIILFLTAKAELVAVGAPNMAAAQPQPWQGFLALVVLGFYGSLLSSVLPVEPQQVPQPAPSPLTFPLGLRVLWLGGATDSKRPWVVAGLVVISVGVAVVSTSAAIVVLIMAGLSLSRYRVRVRINDDGVQFSRLLGWPKHRVPLHTITRASTDRQTQPVPFDDLDDTDDIDARSLIVGKGDALVLETTDHLPLHVSVDHADEAADVVNALVARARATTQAPLENGTGSPTHR